MFQKNYLIGEKQQSGRNKESSEKKCF